MNSFYVTESTGDDNSVIGLSVEKIKQLGLYPGDTVLIKANSVETVCIILSDEIASHEVTMNRVVRQNLRVRFGDLVTVEPRGDVPDAKRVHVTSVSGRANLFELLLKPYFKEAYRPVTVGDTFIVQAVEFKVMATDPHVSCIVTPDTLIFSD